jgi:hypothetical protein
MKKREVIHTSRFFHLVRQQRDHKKWYEIQVCATWYNVPEIVEHEISDYFGKSRDNYAKTWRFWNRIVAEKQFLYASLRWN